MVGGTTLPLGVWRVIIASALVPNPAALRQAGCPADRLPVACLPGPELRFWRG